MRLLRHWMIMMMRLLRLQTWVIVWNLIFVFSVMIGLLVYIVMLRDIVSFMD